MIYSQSKHEILMSCIRMLSSIRSVTRLSKKAFAGTLYHARGGTNSVELSTCSAQEVRSALCALSRSPPLAHYVLIYVCVYLNVLYLLFQAVTALVSTALGRRIRIYLDQIKVRKGTLLWLRCSYRACSGTGVESYKLSLSLRHCCFAPLFL